MTRTSGTRGRVVATVVAAVLLVAACGVDAESDPRALPENEVPFELLSPPTPETSTTSTTEAPAPTVDVDVYLVAVDRLVAMPREVTRPVTAAKVLEELFAGPTTEETDQGVRTAISPTTTLVSVTVTDTTATVDLSGGFDSGTTEQLTSVAQIVFTATGVAGVDRVALQLDGRAIEVPTADGVVKAGPLVRGDFTALAVPPTSTTAPPPAEPPTAPPTDPAAAPPEA
ncbi:MAG: GerMN domain-containing protein [Acidimicrobiia bacterium]|nr:GerMN domain-containing protein [Acidimicrobiia bacterium]